MRGIEGIGRVLERLAAAALLAIIEPDERQGAQGEALRLEFERADHYRASGKQELPHDDHGRHLDETVGRATLAGEPEQQDEEHAVPIVVRHQQVRQRHSRRKPQRIQRPLGRGDVLLRQMIRTIAGAKTGQQRPCDVLVPDVENVPPATMSNGISEITASTRRRLA